ncbi:AfsR/SARP family transcriptional regulator [Streptacidiphilus rugosus]|uniref:AfsR/SARP family transcriptional regulator n=1 Tax=Streptacidiphilus rugosus TaxID=405783 RepID=UPI00069077F6|nr:BTAD domain-containing putative transcriptional regulator [Streptacidiphilus rugosus]
MDHPQATPDAGLRFGLLGPLAVGAAGAGALDVSSPKVRTLLAVLLLEANQPVSRERLVLALWGETPPATATAALNNAVLRLRRTLGQERVRTAAPGYLLAVEPGEFDVESFESLARAAGEARSRGDWQALERACTTALALWRGTPLADLPDLAEQETPRLQHLQETRLQTLEWRAEARLRLGQEQDAIRELTLAAAEHPLREVFHEQLMSALHRVGRQADALAVYRRIRTTLAEELGIDPGPRLVALHQRILAAEHPAAPDAADAADPPDGTLADRTAGTAESHGAAPPLPVPSQLPAAPADFTGRSAEAALLADRLDAAGAGTGARVCTVTGTGGLGKTSLALHVAHRLADRFPDGRLYVDLRGVASDPADPADVLADFLRDFGVPDEAIPVGVDARAARFRSLLAGRRVLLVLDNARDSAQLRPLLPGSPECATLVTGRRRLPGLAGATLVDLERLDDGAARELFAAVVGAERTGAEPEATEEVLAHCAGLPLALRIAAARLSHRRGWSVASMAARLADHSRRLDELRADDLAVRASFLTSYENLGTGSQQVFRLLGMMPGPDVSLLAMAAVLDRPVADTEDALELLVDACLLESPAPGRYRMHDLLRVFAAERAELEESESGRAQARARIVRWYLLGMTEADQVLFPGEARPEALDTSDDGLPPYRPLGFADRARALEWCTAERVNLVHAAQLAGRHALDEYGWRFCSVAWAYFYRTSHIEDWLATADAGLAGVRRLGRPFAEATVLVSRGAALMRLNQHDLARRSFLDALAVRERIGDLSGQIAALNNLGLLARQEARNSEARDFHRRGLALALQLPEGPTRGFTVGSVYGNLGQTELALGNHEEARACLTRALAGAREAGNASSEAAVLRDIGLSWQGQGRHEEALPYLEEAAAVAASTGYRVLQAFALASQGEVLVELGRLDRAGERLAEARALLPELTGLTVDEAAGFIVAAERAYRAARHRSNVRSLTA